MGVIIRQSIQNTVISYVGIVLGFVSTILLYPNILSTDQYGLTRVLISLSIICAQFAHLGVKNIVIRYFPYFQHSAQSRGNLLTLILLVPLGGFLLFITVYLLLQGQFITYYDDQSALFASYYLYLVPLVFAILFFEVLNNYVRALQDSVTGSFVNEVLMRALIILLLVIHHFDLISFTGFMIGFVLTYGIQPFYLLAYLYRRGELNITFPKLDRNTKLLKGMGVYGAYSLLGGLATLLVGNIDIIMLGAMIDLNSTAVYAIAFYVGSVIAVPQRSIIKIASPVLAGLIKEKKYEEIDRLYKRTSLNQIIAGTLLYVGIWANMHNLMDLLPAEYQGAKWIIIVVGAAKLFNMATGINGSIIMNSKYYRFDLYTNIMLIILTIATNYIFIQLHGMLGAAMATALSIFIYNFVKFVFVWITFSMQPFRWNALAVLLTAAACLGLSFQIPYLYNFVLDLLVRSFVITFLFTGVILLFNLSDDVENLLRQGCQKIFHFITG
ncbi:lipopolysaccharide biosynthesis protein [Fodinibius sediminis]|uniref:Membrane protein involved in the export of O-antigen and teichoic acid n=1 Tax=Fodinibius sediminis TaxID=1214077 RepID=A0A521D581_9BACT|nr:oligosaccharide flippase family protein [Fodinibius sediminis]SMO66772.1 Membrane protein involved in the export of O-antigen and teichoic acid [Fodinibius sediminis]